MSKFFTRIIKSELFNFKNVIYGEIKYLNYGAVNTRAEIENNDVIGIYGQNGSGKTAVVEAMDIIRNILSGCEIPYNVYSGILREDGSTKIVTCFYIENDLNKYKVIYESNLKGNPIKNRIEICEEKLSYFTRGATWKSLHEITFSNPYYNENYIMNDDVVEIQSPQISHFKNSLICRYIKNLAVYCSQNNVSIFFNDLLHQNLINHLSEDNEETNLNSIIKALIHFGRCYLHVVKVNQLGDINRDVVLPINVHNEANNTIIQGCLPLLTSNENRELPEFIYNQLRTVIPPINVALKSIVPNLQIELEKVNEEIKPDNKKYVTFDVYSLRDNNKFLIKYESEGIKRIVSLLHYFISLYNNKEVCLVVDELDSGIFEYLLGELLDVLSNEAKGQLIFTSHNLRAFEKMGSRHFICSTTNPENRYIKLVGIEKNHNHRDFYLRAILLGGQKEELYDTLDLQSIGYAFRKAGKNAGENVKLSFSSNFKKIVEDSK